MDADTARQMKLALEKITDTRQLNTSAIIDYFAPLMAWLKVQNEGQTCGW